MLIQSVSIPDQLPSHNLLRSCLELLNSNFQPPSPRELKKNPAQFLVVSMVLFIAQGSLTVRINRESDIVVVRLGCCTVQLQIVYQNDISFQFLPILCSPRELLLPYHGYKDPSRIHYNLFIFSFIFFFYFHDYIDFSFPFFIFYVLITFLL